MIKAIAVKIELEAWNLDKDEYRGTYTRLMAIVDELKASVNKPKRF